MTAGQHVAKHFFAKFGSEKRDADSLPTVVVYRNLLATVVPVTVSRIALGHYGYEFDVPNDWLVDDAVSVVISMTLSGASTEVPLCLGTITDLPTVARQTRAYSKYTHDNTPLFEDGN